MKIFYISPSLLPSRSANSVHVTMQCHALIKHGVDVSLFARRSIVDSDMLPAAIERQYGVNIKKLRLFTFHSYFSAATSIRIAMNCLFHLTFNSWPDVILSRNLYASFIIAILLRRPIIFETHQLEMGFRKHLQRALILSNHVATIVISEKLIQFLKLHHDVTPTNTHILHDAAPESLHFLPFESRRKQLCNLIPQCIGDWRGVCGYFGHLYPGRGIEVIEAMAFERPDVLFLIFGGNESDIEKKKRNCSVNNLLFLGHVSHKLALDIMRSLDILLMPYQESVSIGVSGHDTAQWMSPMKMFEYMSSGVPIVSSDLPVLREVLKSGKNSLLVSPSNVADWLQAIDKLLDDDKLCMSIGINAYQDYQKKYTWSKRAESIITIAKNL